ncbi:MAG TPA: twin-arginine translocase subunit TatC [Bdellovibrionota bacterium]|nr:twin-arginine translocase subunit TatC [Bdellovibrionota bacterium]
MNSGKSYRTKPMPQEESRTDKESTRPQGAGGVNSERAMGFFEHLDELRSRLMRCLVVFMVGFVGCYFLVTDWVMQFLRAPLFHALPPDRQKLYFTGLFENFLTHLKIAAVTAIFVTSPYLLQQAWAFVAPGLYTRERKAIVPFVVSGTILFFGGAAFAYYVLFPAAFHFFITYGLDTDVPLLTIDAYYTTCLKLLLLFGAAFELPLFVVGLGYFGIIDAPFLRQNRSRAVVGITVLCALFAPPDAISMLILMAPLVLMYEGAILVVAWMGRKRAREAGTQVVEKT